MQPFAIYQPIRLGSYGFCLLVVLPGCISTDRYVEHYQYNTAKYRGATISNAAYNQWSVSQQTSVDAAISLTPG